MHVSICVRYRFLLWVSVRCWIFLFPSTTQKSIPTFTHSLTLCRDSHTHWLMNRKDLWQWIGAAFAFAIEIERHIIGRQPSDERMAMEPSRVMQKCRDTSINIYYTSGVNKNVNERLRGREIKLYLVVVLRVWGASSDTNWIDCVLAAIMVFVQMSRTFLSSALINTYDRLSSLSPLNSPFDFNRIFPLHRRTKRIVNRSFAASDDENRKHQAHKMMFFFSFLTSSPYRIYVLPLIFPFDWIQSK